MLRVGTHHFVDRKAAVRYYKTCGEDAKAVTKRIKDGAICIGEPAVKENEKLILEDGRYFLSQLELFEVSYGATRTRLFAETTKEAKTIFILKAKVPVRNHYMVQVWRFATKTKEMPNAQ